MKFSLTILGSSSALPTSQRFLSAQVLNVHERFFLIDCGEGTQIQLRRNRIKFGRINHIFISHLHGDHVFGLPGLISTFNLLGRKTDLHIYAHKPLKQILNQFLGQFYTSPGFKLIYHIIPDDTSAILYSDEVCQVESFPLKHRITCSGFLFKENPKLKNIRKDAIERYGIPLKDIKSIKEGADFITDEGIRIPNEELTLKPSLPKCYAFITDTVFIPELSEKIKEADLLYHEATYLDNDTFLAQETGHSTAKQAATLAQLANVKKLVLGHFSSRYKSYDEFLIQAKEVFSNVVLAEESLEIQI